MAYSSNPLLPKARKWTINLVLKEGLSISQAALRAGVHRTTVWRWLKRWQEQARHGNAYIPTRSSRPRAHPKQLSTAVVQRIILLRQQLRRCAYIIWRVLVSEHISVSLSSVGRVLARAGLTSSWYGAQGKQRRKRVPRPRINLPGDLVQVDTIHFADWKTKQRYFVYTLIDIKSRFAYAAYTPRISPELSWYFIAAAERAAGFRFRMIQSDNGTEFGKQLEQRLQQAGIQQRRIRLGRKNDNAHIERFNRTLQDEALGRWPNPETISDKLIEYLEFYNTKRLHCSLQGKTPMSVLQRF